MINGIDVSHWQSPDKIKKIYAQHSEIRFVMIKATEGTTYIDKAAAEHLKNALDADKQIGFYHYARAEKNDAKKEADHFINTISSLINNYDTFIYPVLALDFEGKCFTLKPDQQDKWAYDFCRHVYNFTGIRPLLYVQQSKIKNFPTLAQNNYGLWAAKWGTKKPDASPWPFWAIWQQGQKNIDGMEVDWNVFNGGVEQFRRYGNAPMG